MSIENIFKPQCMLKKENQKRKEKEHQFIGTLYKLLVGYMFPIFIIDSFILNSMSTTTAN